MPDSRTHKALLISAALLAGAAAIYFGKVRQHAPPIVSPFVAKKEQQLSRQLEELRTLIEQQRFEQARVMCLAMGQEIRQLQNVSPDQYLQVHLEYMTKILLAIRDFADRTNNGRVLRAEFFAKIASGQQISTSEELNVANANRNTIEEAKVLTRKFRSLTAGFLGQTNDSEFARSVLMAGQAVIRDTLDEIEKPQDAKVRKRLASYFIYSDSIKEVDGQLRIWYTVIMDRF